MLQTTAKAWRTALLLLALLAVSSGYAMGNSNETAIHDSTAHRHQYHDLALTSGKVVDGDKSLSWLNIGLLGNTDNLRGLQVNALTSFTGRSMYGLQVAGISNLANNMRGVQLSIFNNVSLSPFRGVQLAGITNISRGVKKGIQLSAMANISSSYMRGLQIGAYNYADTLNGSQIGFLNICTNHPRGVQIGIVNYSRDTVAHKIGLVNVNPKTNVDIMVYGGSSTKFNAAFRFRNRSTYSIIGFGTHYMGLDEDFSGAVFYRLGQYFNIGRKWSLSADAGFFHVETFQHNSSNKPERLYSLQLRANLDYQLSKHAGLFASVGYGDTRYYSHNRRYRNRMIFEAGVTLGYDRSKIDNTAQQPLLDDEARDSSSVYAFNNPANLIKRPWKAAAEAFGINVLVNSFDRFVLNEDFAKISMHSIHENIKNGFVWDNDQFSTNLFAHPYHGGLYFNSARSNGMNFWESTPYALCGSLMWEMACETEPPAINDLIATTVGGICIGEVTHRVSSLVYDDRERGASRFLRELAGAVLCPIRAFNRIISGDAWRVRHSHYKYHDYERLPIDFSITVGDRYLADEGAMFRGEHNPYIDLLLNYGDAFDNTNGKPYDYFTANVTFGLSGNQPLISSVHLLGRLWSAPVYEGKEMTAVFGIFQHFNYYDSKAVKDGTSRVPYRISEAASIGPGMIYKFPKVGNLGSLEQRIFFDGILLGGSLSDYYNIIDRDYNMGSGFSTKLQTLLEFPKFGKVSLFADFYEIFTWKGYEQKDLEATNPLYLNAQGDKGRAALLVINPRMQVYLKHNWSLDLNAAYYMRKTHYKFHDDVRSETYEVRIGLTHTI